jgi:putative copper export protein
VIELLEVARWIGYLGVMGLVGAASFQCIVHLQLGRRFPGAQSSLLGRVRAAAFLAALFLVFAEALKLLGQLRSFVDPGEAITREIFNLVVFESGWGHSWQLQALAAGITLLLVLFIRNTWVLVPLALVTVGLAPLTGHATENPWGFKVGLLLHSLHQLGGGVWIGTLLLVIAAGYGGSRHMPDAERHPFIATLVHAYSPVALVGVSTAVLAGLIMALGYLDPLSTLWSTGYGRMLIVKVALMGGTAAIGAYNWRLVRPRLGEEASSRRLYRSATLELILGSLLLAATSVLVALPAPALE